MPALFRSSRPQEAVPLKLERAKRGKREDSEEKDSRQNNEGMLAVNGVVSWSSPGCWELGGPARGSASPTSLTRDSKRRIRASHYGDGLARLARLEFFGDTVVFSCSAGSPDLERSLLNADSWPSSFVPFTFGHVDIDEREPGGQSARGSLSLDRPTSLSTSNSNSVVGLDLPVTEVTNGKLVIGAPPSSTSATAPSQLRVPGNFSRSTSTPMLANQPPAPVRSLSSYLWGTPSSSTPNNVAPAITSVASPPVPTTPAIFHCALGALSAPLQPFLRSSHVSFLAFGTGGAAQAWDAERPFAALPLDPELPAGWTRLGCPEPRMDLSRMLYSLALILPPQNAWTGRPKMRITRTDLADEMKPGLLTEFEHPPCFPWTFAMTRNYLVVFGGPADCSLEYPGGAPRRSFSFPRSSTPVASDGFKPPPVLRQSFEITKPTTYTVINKHTGELVGRLSGRAPGGIPREVIRANDTDGILTMDILFHADLSAHECLRLDSLRQLDGYDRVSPVRLARVTLDPARGLCSEAVLTHAPLSCFLPLPGGSTALAVSHPPWLSPGPHAWEASSLVKIDLYDGEVCGRLKTAGGEKAIPAGHPIWLGDDGSTTGGSDTVPSSPKPSSPMPQGVIACPLILLADAESAEPFHAILLVDPTTLEELARVVLPQSVPWLYRGAWIPPDDDRWESPVGSMWTVGSAKDEEGEEEKEAKKAANDVKREGEGSDGEHEDDGLPAGI